MTDRIIDLGKRYPARFRSGSAARPNPAPTIDVEAQSTERNDRQKREVAKICAVLNSRARLDAADRKIIARNLGRAIERQPGLRSTQVVAQLFRTAYGEEGGASREKKRKRYVRFDGESLNDQGKGQEFAASGQDFLRLAETLAEILYPDLPPDLSREQMLLAVCDGVSFCGPSRPRLQQDLNLADRFRQTMTGMIDRIVRETDIVAYLTEAQDFSIKVFPSPRDDIISDALEGLNFSFWPIEQFEHVPEGRASIHDEYSRLKRKRPA